MTTRDKAIGLAAELVVTIKQLRVEDSQTTALDAARLEQDTCALQQAEAAHGYLGDVFGNAYDSAGNLAWVSPIEKTPKGIFGEGPAFG